VAELERLAALKASGALDEDEFRLAKVRLLSHPTPTAALGPSAQIAPSADTGRGNVLGAAAAGAVGGMLLSNVGTAAASPVNEPITDAVTYHETVTGPDGETMTIDGSMESSVTFDESGDAHVTVHDEGTMGFDGETYDYSNDIEGDVDLPGGDDAGGFLDGLFG
jgi:hypothetical protein